MTGRHGVANRRLRRASDVSTTLEGTIESTSTRVLVDGNGSQCHTCDEPITAGNRYRCVTLRGDDGTVSEVYFCGDDCVDATVGDDGTR